MKLNKRYLRNIKDNLSFYVSAGILTVVTLLLFFLFHIAGSGILRFADTFFEEHNIEDANFTTYMPISDDDIKVLEQKFDVNLEAQPYVNVVEDNYTVRIFRRTEKVDLYEITQGSQIESDEEILISEGYAVNMDIGIGDILHVAGKDYTVAGYFQRPDYLYMLETLDDSYKNITTFFLAYLSDEAFEQLGDTSCQYLVRYHKENEKEFRIYVNEQYMMSAYTTAEKNPRISMVRGQADMFVIMSYVLLCILPLVAVALVSIIISRKVKSEQRMIGTLSALGYRKNLLMWHYAGFAAIPGLFGGVLSATAAAIFAQPYGECGLADYEPMHAVFTLSPYAAVFGVAIPTVMYVGAALISVKRLLCKDTVLLLGGNAGGEKKRLKRILTGRRISFGRKYALRSLLGNPARTFVVFLGIFLGSFIMLFSFSIIDSIDEVMNVTVDEMGDFEYEYILNELLTEEPEDGETMLVMNFEDISGHSFAMFGTEDDNPYLNLKDLDGNSIIMENEYYATSLLAEILDIGQGDELILYHPFTMEEYKITVGGIIDNTVQKGIFTSKNNVAGLLKLEQGTYNAIMSDHKLDTSNIPVAETVQKSATADQCRTIMDEMGVMIYVLVGLGVIICIAAIYVAVNMMVMENRNTISILKVLGYNDSKINKIVLNVNHILLPLGILISIPLVYLSCDAYYSAYADTIGMLIPVVISAKSYILTILLTSVSYFGSLFLIRRKVKNVDMVESLKDNRE